MKNRTIWKKVTAVTLALTMALSLSACADKGGKTSDSPETTSKTAAGSGEGGLTEVVFWHSSNGAAGEALEQVIKTYNETRGKEKGIKVNLVFQGYEGTDKVILAYQTKDVANAPDINQGLTSTIPQMTELDWTVKVSDMMKKEGSEITEDNFYEALQRACTFEGEMVAVPFAISTLLLYYNVDALKEAGLSNPPATIEEMVEAINKLTVKDNKGTITRYGLNTQIKRYQLVNFCVSQKPDAFFGDQEGGRTGLMTKVTAGEDGTLKKFLEQWEKVVACEGYKPVEDSINEEFAQQVHAMVLMSSSRIGTIKGLVGDSFEFMTAPMPKVNASDSSGASVGGSCLTMFDRGDEKRVEAAWDVLKYCASPEVQQIFSQATGYIPVVKEVENLPEMKAYYEENPQYLVALEQMKQSNPMAQEPFDLVYNDINKVTTDIMTEFCIKSLTVDEAVEKIVNSCNDLLDEYHYANN